MPFGVERPSMARRSLANALIACSALLLFQGTGKQRTNLVGQFAHLTRQSRGLHFQGRIVLPIHDLAEANLSPKHFRQYSRIKCQ